MSRLPGFILVILMACAAWLTLLSVRPVGSALAATHSGRVEALLWPDAAGPDTESTGSPENRLAALIASATRSVDIALYSLDSDTITRSITEACAAAAGTGDAGLRVRVLADGGNRQDVRTLAQLPHRREREAVVAAFQPGREWFSVTTLPTGSSPAA